MEKVNEDEFVSSYGHKQICFIALRIFMLNHTAVAINCKRANITSTAFLHNIASYYHHIT